MNKFGNKKTMREAVRNSHKIPSAGNRFSAGEKAEAKRLFKSLDRPKPTADERAARVAAIRERTQERRREAARKRKERNG